MHKLDIGKIKLVYKTLLLLAIMMGTFFLLGGKSEAATLSVAAGTDTVAVDSICGLSEAVTNLNDQANTNADCVAVGAYGNNDTVTIAAGTINTPGNVCVNKSAVVQGAGMNDTIINVTNPSSYGAVSVCSGIDGGSGDPLPLTESIVYTQRDMTTNGGIFGIIPYFDDSAGALIVTLTFDRMKLIDCLYCLYLYPQPTQLGSVVDITVNNIEVIAGQSSFGVGSLAVGTNSTISVNNLSAQGAFQFGIAVSMLESSAVVNLSNMSLSGSHQILNITSGNAGGGSFAGGGIVNLKNNTLVRQVTEDPQTSPNPTSFIIENSSNGLGEPMTVNVQNMLLADNQDDNCAMPDAAGPWLVFNSLGGNLSDDNSCAALFTDTKDQNNLTSLTAPLGVYGNNDGFVPTIALLSGSPAVDAGVCAGAPTSDARGVSRPQGVGCDSGAYELGASTSVAGSNIGVSGGLPGTLAETGVIAISAVVMLAIFLISLSFVYIDYRHHKKPLLAIDPNIHYSLIHHMRVVTLPLFRYRLSIKISKVNPLSKEGVHRF